MSLHYGAGSKITWVTGQVSVVKYVDPETGIAVLDGGGEFNPAYDQGTVYRISAPTSGPSFTFDGTTTHPDSSQLATGSANQPTTGSNPTPSDFSTSYSNLNPEQQNAVQQYYWAAQKDYQLYQQSSDPILRQQLKTEIQGFQIKTNEILNSASANSASNSLPLPKEDYGVDSNGNKVYNVTDPNTGKVIQFDNLQSAQARFNQYNDQTTMGNSFSDNMDGINSWDKTFGTKAGDYTVHYNPDMPDNTSLSILNKDGEEITAQLSPDEVAQDLSQLKAGVSPDKVFPPPPKGVGGMDYAQGIAGLAGIFFSFDQLGKNMSISGLAGAGISGVFAMRGLIGILKGTHIKLLQSWVHLFHGNYTMAAGAMVAIAALMGFLIGKFGARKNQAVGAGDAPAAPAASSNNSPTPAAAPTTPPGGLAGAWYTKFGQAASANVFLFAAGVTSLAIGINLSSPSVYQSVHLPASQIPQLQAQLSQATGQQLGAGLGGKVFVYASGDGGATPDKAVYVTPDANGDGGVTVNAVSLNYNGYMVGGQNPGNSYQPFFTASANGTISPSNPTGLSWNQAAVNSMTNQQALETAATSQKVSTQSSMAANFLAMGQDKYAGYVGAGGR